MANFTLIKWSLRSQKPPIWPSFNSGAIFVPHPPNLTLTGIQQKIMMTHIINSQAISHIYGSSPFCTARSAIKGISCQMWSTTMQLFWSALGKPHQTPTRKTQQTPLQWGNLLGTWRAVRQVMWWSSRCRGWRAGRSLSVALTRISSDRVNTAMSCTQCTEEPLHSETEPTHATWAQWQCWSAVTNWCDQCQFSLPIKCQQATACRVYYLNAASKYFHWGSRQTCYKHFTRNLQIKTKTVWCAPVSKI